MQTYTYRKVFLEIIFGKKEKITASASHEVVKLVSMLAGQMLLQLVYMQSLEFTLVALQLHEVHVSCTHRCSKQHIPYSECW